MPNATRSRVSTRTRLRQKHAKKYPKASTVATIARKTAMGLKETKKQTITVTPTLITNADTHSSIENWTLAQGDTSVSREGNEVYATSFYHKFIVHANQTGSNSSFLRLVLYSPRHDKDDTITSLTVLNSIDTDKFKVLYDRTVELGYGSGHARGAQVITVKRKFRKAAKLYYAGHTAQAPISPVMKWLWVSDQPTSSKPPTSTRGYISFQRR